MLIWLSAFCVLSGSIITFIAALGVLRLPDFFMRMHAATKAGVVGPSLILVGAGLYQPSWDAWIKIALAILFLFMTTPIASHLLGKAGFIGGVSLWEGTARNDLDNVLPSHVFVESDASTSSEQPAAKTMASAPKALPEQ
ncbi:monovalent cation/H(+) antiporter subunit G [Pusillimonas sp. SM2304]|uniref:monovalent cation/H(+) antiporter subunit G n=1 Tax=Pusillimonas sp. SM2304 TaxID=3073241 RepID=UPI00287556BA|nr:monovalent cation/H(+) antiporter subunit G [Pusillimonas sp. SM2304]MDS1139450.1 monovalent cation/H(+) antiporter subunit G [Pusillimonas sp. SM2304]